MGNEQSAPEPPAAAGSAPAPRLPELGKMPATAATGAEADGSEQEPEPDWLENIFGWFNGDQKKKRSRRTSSVAAISEAAAASANAPTQVDDPKLRYELLRQVGKGSYGRVFSGRDRESGELVALKELKLEQDEDLDKLLAEIDTLRSCDSSHVLRFVMSHLLPQRLWIVTELCEASLADVMQLRRKPLTEPQLAASLAGALAALRYLHGERAMLHRDIKAAKCARAAFSPTRKLLLPLAATTTPTAAACHHIAAARQHEPRPAVPRARFARYVECLCSPPPNATSVHMMRPCERTC